MRIQQIIILLLLSTSFAWASDDSDVKDLFNKYERVVSKHETDLIDDVFSSRFLKDNGGKEEFIEKVKSEPKSVEKAMIPPSVTWKKAVQGESILAKLQPKATGFSKSSKKPESHSEFILVKENGKLKIDGTISDGE